MALMADLAETSAETKYHINLVYEDALKVRPTHCVVQQSVRNSKIGFV